MCRLLALPVDNTRIALVRLPDCQLLATLEAPEGRPVYQLKFSPDGRGLAAAASGGEVQFWDLPRVRDTSGAGRSMRFTEPQPRKSP